MKKKFRIFITSGFAFLLSLWSVSSCLGQGLEGGWQGSLDVGLVKFRAALVIQRNDQGQYQGFFNNIDDGIYENPLLKVSVKGNKFRGELATGEVLDLGLNSSGNRLEGTYKQAGGSFQKPGKISQLSLKRGMDYLVPRLGADGKPVGRYRYKVPKDFPDGWDSGDLRDFGADIKPIEIGIQKILDGTFPRIHSLTLVRHGKLVLDEYFFGYGPDDIHPVQSITKSVFSLLFGMALERGWVKPEDKLYDFFPAYREKPGWNQAKESITLWHLLTMTSGLGCDDWKDSKSCSWAMVDSPDWTDFILSKPLSNEPGKKFAYCGACLTPLSSLLARKSGMSVPEFARKNLLETLQIHGASWVTGPKAVTPVSFGLALKPRDLAKIGLLVLNKGKWNGRQIVSEKWVEEATSTHVAKDQTNGKAGYGYLWWESSVRIKGKDHRMVYAWGVGGQYLWVVPDLDLVCVATGGNYKSGKLGANALRLFQDYILKAFK